MKLFKNPFLLPGIFLLSRFKLWLGMQTFAADTGDGIGAFKFFTLPLPYWNFFEGAGQPYWTEMAVYRLQDPLMWPFLFFVKALPINPLIQFNLYLLLRIALLGLGTHYLLKAMGCRLFSRQLGTLIALFGSAFTVTFRSIGALDLLTSFIGISLFTLRYLETSKKIYFWLLTLVLLHSSITYHVLYLVPVALVFLAFYPGVLSKLKNLIRDGRKEFLLAFILLCCAFSAEYLAIKDPYLHPALRSIRYGTWVDTNGKVIDKEWGVGESILGDNLKTNSDDCGSRFSCRSYQLSLLKTFLLQESAWSLTGYISLAGLLLSFLSLLFVKQRPIRSLQGVALFSFVLSLGGQTPIWNLVQKVIPALQYVRHTGFYFHLFVYLLCLIVALTVSHLQEKLSRRFLFALALLVLLDLTAFQRLYVSGFLNFIKPGQLERIASNPSSEMQSRSLRVYNPYLIPRSSAGTTYGEPSVLEPIFVQDTITSDHLKRGENPRYFGFITLFLPKNLVAYRVKGSDDMSSFKERLGIKPFSILSSMSERQKGYSLFVNGDSLKATFQTPKKTPLYLALDLSAVGAIWLNGSLRSFSSAENFGVVFSSDEGRNDLVIYPPTGRRNLIYFLYYGAYLLWCVAAFQPEKFLLRIFRETSFNLSDLLSRTMASRSERT